MGISRAPAPDHEGWDEWQMGDPEHFNHTVVGRILSKRESEDTVRVRMLSRAMHANSNGAMHGAAIVALIDTGLYPSTRVLTGNDAINVTTIDLQVQFISPANLTSPLDALITLTRETGRMLFTRGVAEQDDKIIASFTALQRKIAS